MKLLQHPDPIEGLSESNPEPNSDDDQLQVVSLSLSRTFVTKEKSSERELRPFVNAVYWV